MRSDIYKRLHELAENLRNEGLNVNANRIKDAVNAGCTSSEILNDTHKELTQILTQKSLPDFLKKEVKSIMRSIEFVLFKTNIGL